MGDFIEYAGIAIVPLIVGLSEVAKTTGLKTRYIPLLNLIIGILTSVMMYQEDIAQEVIKGIYFGLSAAGLYSGSKYMIQDMRQNKKED